MIWHNLFLMNDCDFWSNKWVELNVLLYNTRGVLIKNHCEIKVENFNARKFIIILL